MGRGSHGERGTVAIFEDGTFSVVGMARRGANNLAASRWALLLMLVVAGCSVQPLRPATRVPVLPERSPPPKLETLPQTARTVAVVLSAESPVYRAVADALGKGPWSFYVLDGGNAKAVLRRLRAAHHRHAIAIGRRALDLLASSALDVVYCQVFEPSAADVAAPAGGSRRGVAPLPDFGAQLDAWRSQQPGLSHIGLITGSEYRQVADSLAAAARARGLTLQRAVVANDQELLYVFRRMVPEIDGFLLYPDTSILSPRAIRELLAYARKHSVRVLTYSPAVYRLGASLLISTDPREVARKAVAALTVDAGPADVPLSHVVIRSADPAASGG